VGQIPGVSSELANTLKTAGGYAKTGSALQKAIESKDILGALGAASDIPGVPQVPSDITDILKGVGQANRIREAVKNDNFQGLFNEIVGASKAGSKSGKGYFPGYETPGEIQEGFFDVGGPGYMEPDAGDLPDWALDPYGTSRSIRDVGDVTQIDPLKELAFDAGMTPEGFYLEEIDTTPDWAKIASETIQPRATAAESNDLQSYDIINNLPDQMFYELPEALSMQDLYQPPGILESPSTIEITGRREGAIIPDAVTTSPSIRDVGPVTTISPGEKLEGTEIKEPDLAAGLTTVTGGTTKTGTTKTTTDQKKNEIDWAKLFALLGSMQRPEDKKEQYQLPNMPKYGPLAYGYEVGETPYTRG
jgi:hypothetical protein